MNKTLLLLHFTDEKTEAKDHQITCPKPAVIIFFKNLFFFLEREGESEWK